MTGYLKEETNILRGKIGKKRIILNDNQGKLLSPEAAYLEMLGRRAKKAGTAAQNLLSR